MGGEIKGIIHNAYYEEYWGARTTVRRAESIIKAKETVSYLIISGGR